MARRRQLPAASSGPPVEIARGQARPVWFDAFLVAVVAFALFAATAQYHDPLNNDTRATALAAWQLAHHGNATLTAFNGHYAWLFNVHGRDVTNRLPGTVLWAAPFYAVLGSSAAPAIYPAALAADTACAIAIGATFAVCCQVVSRRIALVAAMLLAFATGTWTVSGDQLWTEGPAQAAILLTLLFVSRRQWLAAGVPAGFAILIRPHLGVIAVVVGLMACGRERRLRPLLISIGSAAGLGALLLYNHAVWHTWSVYGGYPDPSEASGHTLSEFGLGIVGALVSPERGLLVMTPALLLLLPGCRAAWRVAPWWVRSATFAGLAYLAVQIWISRFSGGNGFYSYRTTLESLTLAVPLLALAWREWTAISRARRTAFASLAAVSVALHAFGAIVNWVPGGESRSPWKSYLPIDLARHIGATQSALWAAAALVAVIAAAIVTWRASTPTTVDAGLERSSDVAIA